jgi:16S rRNA (adenine1518-N6/adenine1519-N6)-dimethyltransferase
MTAIPGTREYGILSVITQLFSEVAVVKTLPPAVFWPSPAVHSAIVKVVIHKEKYADRVTDYPFFRKIVYAIFTSRRKTLINSLEKLNIPTISREHLKGIIRDMQLDERIRGENLDVDQLIHLSETIGKLKIPS